jgi:adenylate kinase
VRKRLEVYSAETAPLIDYYRAKGKLRTIDGELPIEDVSRAVRAVFAEKT